MPSDSRSAAVFRVPGRYTATCKVEHPLRKVPGSCYVTPGTSGLPGGSRMLLVKYCLFELRHACPGVPARSGGGQDILFSAREHLCGQLSKVGATLLWLLHRSRLPPSLTATRLWSELRAGRFCLVVHLCTDSGVWPTIGGPVGTQVTDLPLSSTG